MLNSSRQSTESEPSEANWQGIKDYLSTLVPHSVYDSHKVGEILRRNGLLVEVLPDSSGLYIDEYLIRANQPDYGQPGIWALKLANWLYMVATGEEHDSQYIGVGFQYRELLEKFSEFLGVPEDQIRGA